jgi:hypothetical protein
MATSQVSRHDMPGPRSLQMPAGVVRILAAGLALAALAGCLVAFGDTLGLDLQLYALFGLAIGASVGLATGHPAVKAAGFLIGFVVGWGAYALRAAVLPDTSTGRAISAVLVVTVLTVVAAAWRSRSVFVAELLGLAALAGAYETTFNTLPSAFRSTSVIAATTVLFAAAFGYLLSQLIGAAPSDGDEAGPTPARPSPPPPPEQSAGFSILDRPNREA